MLGTLAHHPALARAFHTFNGHVLFATSLSVRQRELVVLRVAAVRRSTYEWAQHVVIDRDAGLTDDEILQIAADAGVTGIDACVADGTYSPFVTSMTQETPVQPGSSGIGTPTLAVNGEVIANSTIPAQGQLATLFE